MNFHKIVREVLTRFCERHVDVDVALNQRGDGAGAWDLAVLEQALGSAFAEAFERASGCHLSVTSDAEEHGEVLLVLEISGRDRASDAALRARAVAEGWLDRLRPHIVFRVPRQV